MDIKEADLLGLTVASLYMGEPVPWTVRGTIDELKALGDALMATHLFEQEVGDDKATVSSVIEALDRKHRAAARFQKLFGRGWPL